jgi:hypothetical protein
MKNFVLLIIFLAGVYQVNAQKKVIDYIDTDVMELSETRAAVYAKYATGKAKGIPMSKDDEDLIFKINAAIAANPKPNAKIQMKSVPVEYSYENLKTMYQRLNMYFQGRQDFLKFKKGLKAYAAQDSTVYERLQKDLNVGKQRFKQIATDKEDQ